MPMTSENLVRHPCFYRPTHPVPQSGTRVIDQPITVPYCPALDFYHIHLGCPRNNEIVFSVRTETNQNSNCFGCFSVCFAKPKLFFQFVSYRYRNNRNKQNFFETNRKNLQKTFSISGSSKPLIFFLGLNRIKPKLDLFW